MVVGLRQRLTGLRRLLFVPVVSKRKISEMELAVIGRFVLATKRGLFLLENDGLFAVLDGHFYGVTRDRDLLYVFEKIDEDHGRLLALPVAELDRDSSRCAVVMGDLSPGCHQIDYHDGGVWITDTYNNRISRFDPSSGRTVDFYPKGRLDRGRESKNYAHFNSVFVTEDEILVFCHNETKKTGRPSSILALDERGEVLREIETAAGNGHNIARYEGNLLYCDSNGQTLERNGETVFRTDYFTRGLSITEQYYVLGGSEYARRQDREKAAGVVYFLDRQFNELGRVSIPGMVQEIRRLDGPDFALSAHGAPGVTSWA
jgi:hypothetical protein